MITTEEIKIISRDFYVHLGKEKYYKNMCDEHKIHEKTSDNHESVSNMEVS